MPQVFISYAHVDPDQQLAARLCRSIESAGFEVFVDSKIRVGQDWVEQIDTQLRQSAYFVVLISEVSVKSDMVRREIAIAYKLKKANRLVILPVRIDFEDELPYDVGAYLDAIQYVSWKPEEPFDPICRMIGDCVQIASTAVPVTAALSHPNRFDAADLDRIKHELARYIGPVARIIVDRAAAKADSLDQVCNLVAAEIPTAGERKQFLAIRRP